MLMVDAMWRMLQNDSADDFVIATGEAYSLEDFVAEAFMCVDLDWREFVSSDQSLIRPTEIMIGLGNSTKACEKLGWQASKKMKDVVRLMVKYEDAYIYSQDHKELR